MPGDKTAIGTLGAVPSDGGGTIFRAWAPQARSMAVRIGRCDTELVRGEDDIFAVETAAGPDEDCVYVLDGERERTVRAPRHRHRAHARGHLASDHGWGYDGVYNFAPHPAYGGAEGLTRLVDAAHDAGLAVIFDVVYNHLGAGSDAVEAFGSYTSEGQKTIWGGAIDCARPAIREWALQNAEMWVRDYRIDGLRLDATHAILEESEPHILTELARRVRTVHSGALIISEMEIGDRRPIEEWGHDAQREDALHHAVHVLLTGEQEGYYAQYGTVQDVADELQRPEGRRFITCAQNHDQVGNRAVGDRLRGRDLRLAAFCSILSAGTPMLFAGEEYDESHPSSTSPTMSTPTPRR